MKIAVNFPKGSVTSWAPQTHPQSPKQAGQEADKFGETAPFKSLPPLRAWRGGKDGAIERVGRKRRWVGILGWRMFRMSRNRGMYIYSL